MGKDTPSTILNNKKPRDKGVAFFPSAERLSANPYWPMLAAALEEAGMVYHPDTPRGLNLRWLVKNRGRVRILHFHYMQPFYKASSLVKMVVKLALFFFNLVTAKIMGYRTVFTLHNLEPTYPLEPAWLDYLGQWIGVNLSGRVIIHCEEARKLLTERYRRKRQIFLVDHPSVNSYYPNSIPKAAARECLGLSMEQNVFLFFGGIRPNKGIEILIEAFSQLNDENYRLLIVGKVFCPEDYMRGLETMAACDDRISFHLGYFENDAVQIYLNAADVVVLPFARILTSSSTILAMSFSRPVIVPAVGCLPELIKSDCGWLFEHGESESLRQTMIEALENNLTEVGAKAFEKISRYTSQRFVAQTLQAYYY